MSSSSPQPASHTPALAGASGHNPVLDGIRGMAILMVMWHHNTVLGHANPIDSWYHAISGLGAFGVDLFFVLSGFLITGILYDSKVRGPQTFGSYFGNFYARRTLRIFPLYYAVVIFSLLILPHVGDALKHVTSPASADLIQTKLDRFAQVKDYDLYFWLYLSNFPIAITAKWLHGILGVSWSLAIEEQFYLIWPFVVYYFSRRTVIRACLVLIVLAFLCRVVLTGIMLRAGTSLGEDHLPLANPLGIYVFTLCRMDTLAFGALVALLLRGSFNLSAAAAFCKRVLWVGLPLTLALALAEEFVGRKNPAFGIGSGPLFQTVGFTMTAMVATSALVLAINSPQGGFWNRFWSWSFLRTLGKYAYALYLFHLPIRAVIRDMVYGPRPESGTGGPRIAFFEIAGSQLPAQMLFYAVSIAAALAAAWLSWVLFENQILKLKKYFPSGVEAKPAPRSS